MAKIQIPVLFDMSGDTIIFGEEASGDFVSSHLDFILDMTTEANGISLNAADISSAILVGDQETGDNIFYSGGSSGNIAVDNLCNRIAKAITRGKLVHLPKSGNTSNSGIPMGGRENLYDLNGVYTENGNNDKYAIKYFSSIAPIGDEQMLGQAMARVASIHLVGSPLSAGIFQDKNSVQTQLETASDQTFNSGNTAFYNALAVQLSKVLGGSKSSAPMNPGKIVSGVTDVNIDVNDLTNLTRLNDLANKSLTASSGSVSPELLDNNNVGASHGYNTGIQWETDANATTGTRQHTGSNSTTNVDGSTTLDGPWIQFDAGETVHVSHLKLWGNGNYEGGHSRASAPKRFSILKSDDGTNWTTVKSYNFSSLIPILGSDYTGFRGDPFSAGYFWSGGSARNFEITLDPIITTRYVRMHIEEAFDRTFECNEFQVIGVLDASGSTYQRPPTSTVYEFEPSEITFNVPVTNVCRFASGGSQYTTNSLSRTSGRNYFTSRPYGGQNADAAFNTTKTGEHGHRMSLGTGGFTTDGLVETTPLAGNNGVGKIWLPKEQITNSNVDIAGPYFGIDLGSQIYGTTTSDVSSCKWVVASSKWYGNGNYNNYGRNPRNYTIYYSNDRVNWTIAKQVTQTASSTSTDWPSANVANEDIFDKVIVARYWMFQVNAVWEAATETFVGEWELFGQIHANTTGADATVNSNPPLDASGTSVPALKSIFEQLMNVPGRSQIMETRDVSGVVNNSNANTPGGFPFISGDKLVVYLRPKINFAAQTFPEQHTTLQGFAQEASMTVPVYNISDNTIVGGVTGQTYTHSSTQDNTMFTFENACVMLDTNNRYWISANGTYNNTTGVHEGSGSTTNVDGGNTIAGEWGQIDMGESTWATQLKLTVGPNNDRPPREFYLLGSTNGTNWTTLIHKTDAGPWPDDSFYTYDIATPAQYTYYRYIVIKCYNAVTGGHIASRTAIGKFELKGVKYTELSNPGSSGDLTDISGLITNFTATPQNIEDAFPGKATSGPESESLKWGWMGSANSDTLSLDTTDINDTGTIDLHIWKITITL